MPPLTAALLVLLILCPLGMVFSEALFYEGQLDIVRMIRNLLSQGNAQAIFNSLRLGLAVVLLSTIMAAPLAFLLARTTIGRHGWLQMALLVPFMTPPYINAMGWILFMQKNGLLAQLLPPLADCGTLLFSFWGLALVMSLNVFPFMVLMLKNAFLGLGAGPEEAGAIFGANFIGRARRILFPLLFGNYLIAALLVFVKTLAEYGTPATLGHRIGFSVFTTDIHRYSTTSPIDFGAAASLAMLLTALCLLFWYVQSGITRRRSYNLVGGKGSRAAEYALSPWSGGSSWAFIAVVLFLAIVIPYFSILATSFIKLRGYGLAAGNFTLNHYINIFTANSKGLHALTASGLLAIISATNASILGTAIALIVHGKKGWFPRTLEGCSIMPEMVPGIVIVIGMMIFWNIAYPVLPLYNTIAMLILAYVAMYVPFSVQYSLSALNQLQTTLAQAGRVYGATPRQVLTRITLPLIGKGIAAGWTMIFIISFRELVASSMVAPPGILTVSTFIVREFEQGSVSVGMAMAVICVAMTVTVLTLLRRFFDNAYSR